MAGPKKANRTVPADEIADYEGFLRENRIKINARLNKVLWLCVLTGPAIALGVAAGIFRSVTYWTCLNISVLEAGLSALHLWQLRRKADSFWTSLFALLAIDCLLVYMAYAGVGIYLTWFLVPLLSLMFCDIRIYRASVGINYLFMLLSVWLIAPSYVAVRADYSVPVQYFVSYCAGYTIETLVMFVSGNGLCRATSGYYRSLIEDYKTIREHERRMKRQMDLLDSMAEIYDSVDLLDLEHLTETAVRDERLEAHDIERGEQTHTRMTRRLMEELVPEHLEAFRAFMDIDTLPERLSGKKIISGEFISRESGWFRAQYIAVESGADGGAATVICTTQNIEEEKSKEERLRYISLTDELTRLYNRRSYEEDMAAYEGRPPEEGFALFSIDVNGLKTANDVKGHAAGDELLRGTAECLTDVFGRDGKAYRTGGDEFLAVLRTSDCEAVCESLRRKAAAWHGEYIGAISFSIGYASHAEHPDASVDELEKFADVMMYADKDRYYRSSGLDRRSRSSAFAALCSGCVKILAVDLGADTFSVLNIDEAEKDAQKEFAGCFSDWVRAFAASGGVAEEDREEFLRRIDAAALRAHFANAQSRTFFYRREAGGAYRRAMLNVVRDADYSAERQSVYLSVRLLED